MQTDILVNYRSFKKILDYLLIDFTNYKWVLVYSLKNIKHLLVQPWSTINLKSRNNWGIAI